ncbi:hypothetical protein LCGC14_2675240 [marine sediment metagenome]|uniref:Uncharacterized protein n=1 Tax=marine sediment metagenome TaxID=412755 RepID=A0A0F9CER4_9ZZZZ
MPEKPKPQYIVVDHPAPTTISCITGGKIMVEIKSLSAIAEKWQRVTPGRTEDYKIGINPKRDWETETLESRDNWKAGVDAAFAKGLFSKGVTKAGTKKWQKKALEKGPGRFAEGVIYAGPDFESGFKRFHAAIAAVDLGPRYPRRDPRNLNRVKLIVNALVKEKTGK